MARGLPEIKRDLESVLDSLRGRKTVSPKMLPALVRVLESVTKDVGRLEEAVAKKLKEEDEAEEKKLKEEAEVKVKKKKEYRGIDDE